MIIFRSTLSPELEKINDSNLNVYIEFQNAVKTFSEKKALGTRKKLSVSEEIQPDGKVIKKISQSPEYEWIKFKDALDMVDLLSVGLLAKGLKSTERVVINAETRPEWLISALACFKINAPIVTLYATLGKCYIDKHYKSQINNFVNLFRYRSATVWYRSNINTIFNHKR